MSNTNTNNINNIIKVKNGKRYDLNGWTFVSIQGDPFERGLAYGQLIKQDMVDVLKILRFTVYNDLGVTWEYFIDVAQTHFTQKIKDGFPEFYEEMSGFSKGSGVPIDEVVLWNNYFTICESWYSSEATSGSKSGSSSSSSGSREGGGGGGGHSLSQQERCSAFIAVGDWTQDGKIVCSHNNFSNFIDGQLAKYVIDIKPTQGNRILMNGFPGWIWSGTDFFVTSAGIIGTETTIGGFNAYENNIPISCRIRNAMQYGKTLDDYGPLLLTGNSGDYANSWLFGDINTNEIMRIELGLKYHNTERTKNGFFIGFNAPYDPRIRNLECSNTGFDDIRRHQGARKVRLADLMDEHKGKLNVEIAQKIIADHYDVYLNKENPCSRTCCSHYELDAREYMSDPARPKPFQPRGALDGNVIDSAMAKNMSFVLRWGNSCGMPFDKNKFCDENRVWDHLRPYLRDRPQQPWTIFRALKRKEEGVNGSKMTKRTKRLRPRTNRSRKTKRI